MKVKDKYALITGASTGIGRSISVELGKKGWTVLLSGRRMKELENTRKLVLEAGGKAVEIPADLTDKESIHNLANLVSIEANPLNLIVNVAGVWHGENEVFAGKEIQDFSEKVIIDTFSVGLVAPTLLASYLVPLMPKGSNIINISGTFENGAKGWVPYYVSKRALEDFTVGLAQDLKEKGINVNAISPSDTATEEYQKYFPEDAKDALTPEEIARFVVEVISKGETGKVWVLKKGQEAREDFHY